MVYSFFGYGLVKCSGSIGEMSAAELSVDLLIVLSLQLRTDRPWLESGVEVLKRIWGSKLELSGLTPDFLIIDKPLSGHFASKQGKFKGILRLSVLRFMGTGMDLGVSLKAVFATVSTGSCTEQVVLESSLECLCVSGSGAVSVNGS